MPENNVVGSFTEREESSEGYGLLQAAEKVLVQDETLPQRLKPNSFQSICVRPKQAAEKGTIVAIFFCGNGC